jgi:hypothetical protein
MLQILDINTFVFYLIFYGSHVAITNIQNIFGKIKAVQEIESCEGCTQGICDCLK